MKELKLEEMKEIKGGGLGAIIRGIFGRSTTAEAPEKSPFEDKK